MRFAHPERLWLLLLVAALAWRAWRADLRRGRDWVALGQGGLPPRDGSAAWLLAVAAVACAFAQPQWGRDPGKATTAGHDVVLAVDVSRSMGAEDAVPDRLAVAVESAESLVAALGAEPGGRVGVVAFAGRGILVCPLTENLGAAVEALRSLRPGDLRPGGSDLASALDAARDAFDDQDRDGGRTIVVFSDGEDHPAAWLPVVERLRSEGIVVHCIAVGDAEQGHAVPTQPDVDPEPLRYQGEVVLSRRSDDALSAIARDTAGAFVPLGLASLDLGQLYSTRIEPIARAHRRLVRGGDQAERFAWFLIVGLAFAVAACRPGRVRWVRPSVRAAALAGLAGLLVSAIGADAPSAEFVRQGREAFAKNRFTEAHRAFAEALRRMPDHPVVRYDAAAALYQLGRFDEAQALYLQARERADEKLRVRIDYALGNTALALGDPAVAVVHFDDCLAATVRGADLDAVRADAQENRRFAEELTRSTPDSPDREPSTSPDGQPGPPKRGGTERDGEDSKPEGEPSQGGGGSRRGQGGAGGSGRESRPEGSPEQQLARAMENVREAIRDQLDEPPARRVDRDLKDW